MVLPYMEQTPIYNAINFYFGGGIWLRRVCQHDGLEQGHQIVHLPVRQQRRFRGRRAMGRRRYHRLGATAQTPNDCYGPNICSYRGCIGTTASLWGHGPARGGGGEGYAGCTPDPFNLTGRGPRPTAFRASTGMFCMYTPTASRIAPTVLQHDHFRRVPGGRPHVHPCASSHNRNNGVTPWAVLNGSRASTRVLCRGPHG